MKIEGSIVALITPMDEQGGIDVKALRRLIDFHIDAGTHGIVAVGTTGESATLSVDEHLSVIEEVVNYADKRIPVYAGTGANSTHEAIILTREAERLGADAALLVAPYYNRPTQEGFYQHYKAIANAVSLPQIIYNVPARTASDIHNQTILRLSDIDLVVAVKDATGDLKRGQELLDLCGERLSVLSGDDLTALHYMRLGAQGDISVTANVAPELMSEMCAAALKGDLDLAAECDSQLVGLHKALFVESSPIPSKYAMSKLGYTSNTLRLPLTKLSKELEEEVDQAMKQANVYP